MASVSWSGGSTGDFIRFPRSTLVPAPLLILLMSSCGPVMAGPCGLAAPPEKVPTVGSSPNCSSGPNPVSRFRVWTPPPEGRFLITVGRYALSWFILAANWNQTYKKRCCAVIGKWGRTVGSTAGSLSSLGRSFGSTQSNIKESWLRYDTSSSSELRAPSGEVYK